MKNKSTRRSFVRNVTVASCGITVLSSLSTLNALAVNKTSNSTNLGDSKVDMRRALFNDKQITVKGKLYDSSGQNTLALNELEIWHLAPNSKRYNYKSKLVTNSNGEFEILTDFPNRLGSKMARIYIKHVESETINELCVTNTQAHISGEQWLKNMHLKDDAIFPKRKDVLGETEIIFNIKTN